MAYQSVASTILETSAHAAGTPSWERTTAARPIIAPVGATIARYYCFTLILVIGFYTLIQVLLFVLGFIGLSLGFEIAHTKDI